MAGSLTWKTIVIAGMSRFASGQYAERRFLAPKIRVFVDAMLARIAPDPPWDAFLNLPERTRISTQPIRRLRKV